MYIKLKHVEKMEMKQEGESFSMVAERDDDQFILSYKDTEEDICPMCGEPKTKKHNCGGEFMHLDEQSIVDNILGDFNSSGEGRILIINDEIKVVKK